MSYNELGQNKETWKTSVKSALLFYAGFNPIQALIR
jgi:hypothetical protein